MATLIIGADAFSLLDILDSVRIIVGGHTYHRGYKRLQKTAQGHHDGNDYDVNDYKDKEDKWIRF